MKHNKFGVILILLAVLIALSGLVMADQGVPAVPGAKGITSSTVIVTDGIVMESNSLSWQVANQSLSATTSDGSPLLKIWDTQYTTAYDSSTVAQNGQTSMIRTLVVDTGNKPLSQSNVKADTAITFIATGDGGSITGSENLMMDGASDLTNASTKMICPFGAYPDDVIPAYCNIIQAGGKFDLTVGSVTTAANDRFVGTDATIPVVLNYNINVKPYGTTEGSIPAIGSAMAYVKAHIQEGRGWEGYYPVTGKHEDLVYSESTSVSGMISSFAKSIAYQSGKSLVG